VGKLARWQGEHHLGDKVTSGHGDKGRYNYTTDQGRVAMAAGRRLGRCPKINAPEL
jgi:hypothetical protein